MDEMTAGFEGFALVLAGLAGAVALASFLGMAGLGWAQGRRGAWRAATGLGAGLGLLAAGIGALALAAPWRSPLDPWPALFLGLAAPALAGHALGVLGAVVRGRRGG